jgi:ribonuclease R
MYQKLTEKIAGKPEERILSYLMLRSLKQARYAEENLGHFALAATTYTHFTSPIRRYPDLIVHRILKDVLEDSAEQWEGALPIGTQASSGQRHPSSGDEQGREEHHIGPADQEHAKPASPWSKRRHPEPVHLQGGPIPTEELHAIAEESSQSERRADEAERELMEWKKAKFMQDPNSGSSSSLAIFLSKVWCHWPPSPAIITPSTRTRARSSASGHAVSSVWAIRSASWSIVLIRWRRRSSLPW